jgi:hypothetical protein
MSVAGDYADESRGGDGRYEPGGAAREIDRDLVFEFDRVRVDSFLVAGRCARPLSRPGERHHHGSDNLVPFGASGSAAVMKAAVGAMAISQRLDDDRAAAPGRQAGGHARTVGTNGAGGLVVVAISAPNVCPRLTYRGRARAQMFAWVLPRRGASPVAEQPSELHTAARRDGFLPAGHFTLRDGPHSNWGPSRVLYPVGERVEPPPHRKMGFRLPPLHGSRPGAPPSERCSVPRVKARPACDTVLSSIERRGQLCGKRRPLVSSKRCTARRSGATTTRSPGRASLKPALRTVSIVGVPLSCVSQ